MKKISKIGLVFLFALVVFGFNAKLSNAATIVDSGTCGADSDGKNVTWSLDSDGVLTISGSGEMRAHSLFADFQVKSQVKSIVIENGVTHIGYRAFSGCSSLTSVEIPSSVMIIADEAFEGCHEITELRIDDIKSWLSIYLGPYSNPFGSNPYGSSILEKKKKLYVGGELTTSIKIPNSVTSIGNFAFYGWNSLTSVEIPSSVTSIGRYAFKGCSSLTSVEIPSSVMSIADEAFYGCRSLTSVEIPSSVTSIGSSAFSTSIVYQGCACDFYNKITVDEGGIRGVSFTDDKQHALTETIVTKGTETTMGTIQYTCSECGISYTLDYYFADGECVIAGYSGPDFFHLIIPSSIDGNTVVGIKKHAFSGCNKVTSIEIPSSVTSIAAAAFANCSGVTSIKIPSSVTSIAESTFFGCRGLTSVEIPSSVTSIGSSAFEECYGITELRIDDIKSWLSISYLGSGSNPFGSNLFGRSILERKLYVGGELTTSITIPNSVTSIADYAFCGCSGLTSVEIPSNVTSIGYSAFGGCSSLTSVKIPSNVTSIAESTFTGCSALRSIEIPSSVTSIGSHAFEECYGITELRIDDIKSWLSISYSGSDSNPFGSSSKEKKLYVGGELTTSITIPSSVMSIADYAFCGCSGLTSVEIPNSVTSIGNFAFYNCSSLKSIIIPDSVTKIGVNAIGRYYSNIYDDSRNVNGFIIYGSSNSIAKSYAESNSINYQVVEPSEPTVAPTAPPTAAPTAIPTVAPTVAPTAIPTVAPTAAPTAIPTVAPSATSTLKPMQDKDTIPAVGTEWGNKENTANYVVKTVKGNTVEVQYSAPILKTKRVIIPKSVTLVNGTTARVTTIANNAFKNNKVLQEISIGSAVTTIGKNAFSGCSKLKKIVIGTNVTTINSNAFKNCKKIKTIIINSKKLKTLSKSALKGISPKATIKVPSSKYKEYKKLLRKSGLKKTVKIKKY